MKAPRRERREKVFFVSPDDVFDLFLRRWRGLESGVFRVHWLDGLPDDARVVHVIYEPFRRAFGFFITSASFDDVPDGQETPWANGLDWKAESLAIDRDENEGGAGTARAYQALCAENERLRLLFSDLREDDARLKAAYEQAREEVHAEIVAGLAAGRFRLQEVVPEAE